MVNTSSFPTSHDLWQDVLAVRQSSPLVHSITNLVVMNFNANVLLALGASPVMAHAHDEVVDMASFAQALVLNIGTLEPNWIQSMQLAQAKAHERGIPVVLDPVGAGATAYRNRSLAELIEQGPPNIIRGNASEIMSVAGLAVKTKGVDSSTSSNRALSSALDLADRVKGVVCVSGEVDYVIDEQGRTLTLANGDALMTKVTGVGCSATAMIGAFAAVQPDRWRATAAAMAYLGVAGQVAAEKTRELKLGVGSFQVFLLDAISELDEATFINRLKMDIL